LDRSGAGLAATGTGLLVLSGLGALRRGLLAEQACHLAAGFVSTLLDGSEVEPRTRLINREEFFLDNPDKSLKTGILGRIGRRAAKHDDPP
jgi:hypothetical protein